MNGNYGSMDAETMQSLRKSNVRTVQALQEQIAFIDAELKERAKQRGKELVPVFVTREVIEAYAGVSDRVRTTYDYDVVVAACKAAITNNP